MGWDKCHLWGVSSEGIGRTRFTKLVRICIWKHQNNCKDLFTFKHIIFSYKFRSHRIICLLVTVISLKKMLPRDKTMFVVVSAGVWEKIACTIGVGTGYSWFCLSFFVLLLACVTHTSCSLRAWLRLSEKRGKIAPVLRNLAFSMKLRITDFLFLVFLHITTDGKKQIHQTVSTYLLYCVHFGLAV